MSSRRALLLALPLLLAAACGLRGSTESPALPAQVESQLFCGRLKPDGGIVTDAEWVAFLQEVVTPRFPRGFTVLEAGGQYLDRTTHEITQERTHLLLIVHDDDPVTSTAVDEIADAYRQRFAQREVLRVDLVARRSPR